MEVRNFVTFMADFPDDSEWDENNDIVIPQGKAIADFISQKLSKKGYSCSQPCKHSFYGWEFEISNDINLLCILQFSEPWLLICRVRRSLINRLFNKNDEFKQRLVFESINEILTTDKKFDTIKWFTEEEYNLSSESGAK